MLRRDPEKVADKKVPFGKGRRPLFHAHLSRLPALMALIFTARSLFEIRCFSDTLIVIHSPRVESFPPNYRNLNVGPESLERGIRVSLSWVQSH